MAEKSSEKNIPPVAVGVIGAGSWGTTLANLLAEQGHAVTLWVYEPELCAILKRTRCNPWYLPDRRLHAGLRYTTDIAEAVRDKSILLWATPVKAFRHIFSLAIQQIPARAVLISASKGIEHETLQTVSQIAGSLLPASGRRPVCVLSGPSFAKEVSRKMPTAVVVASKNRRAAALVQQLFATPYFRTYTSQDVLGVELGGALKNVIALAAGIIEGLGLGSNTRAALITRGLAEIIRLGTALGADPMTFAGLSGVGDLVLTCTSTLSRNYTVGAAIGRGQPLQAVLGSLHAVVEGVETTRSAHALARRCGVDMPIVREIHHVLFQNKNPKRALQDLMGRKLKKEVVR